MRDEDISRLCPQKGIYYIHRNTHTILRFLYEAGKGLTKVTVT